MLCMCVYVYIYIYICPSVPDGAWLGDDKANNPCPPSALVACGLSCVLTAESLAPSCSLTSAGLAW